MSWPAEVKGYGVTVQDAKNDALKQIVLTLAEAVRHREPPLLAWQPTTEYVKSHIIRDSGKAGEDFELEDVGPRKTWIYTLKPLDWPALASLDQEAQRIDRRRERLILGNHVFGAVALILLVILGYLRLDDWTGGRYRRGLQMAGGAILAVGGSGMVSGLALGQRIEKGVQIHQPARSSRISFFWLLFPLPLCCRLADRSPYIGDNLPVFGSNIGVVLWMMSMSSLRKPLSGCGKSSASGPV